MRNIFAIMKKELSTYFTTPIAYVCFTGFSIISAYFFLQILAHYQLQIQMYGHSPESLEQMNFNDMVIGPVIYNILVVFLFFIPFMTMRLLAEEKRNRTFEFLLTTPITPFQLLIGKYISSVVLVGVMTFITLLYPIFLALFGSGSAGHGGIEWNSVFTGIFGLFILGCAFASFCLFASSVTESQPVAAIIGFGSLLLWWILGWASRNTEGLAKDLLDYLSIPNHVDGAIKGMFILKDLVFFMSIIALGLFLAYRVIESHRWKE